MTALLLLPSLFLLFIVFVGPLLRYAWLSFHADSVVTGLIAIPNGGANWVRLAQDQRYWQDFAQTLRFAGVSVGLELILALLIALLLVYACCSLAAAPLLKDLEHDGGILLDDYNWMTTIGRLVKQQ